MTASISMGVTGEPLPGDLKPEEWEKACALANNSRPSSPTRRLVHATAKAHMVLLDHDRKREELVTQLITAERALAAHVRRKA